MRGDLGASSWFKLDSDHDPQSAWSIREPWPDLLDRGSLVDSRQVPGHTDFPIMIPEMNPAQHLASWTTIFICLTLISTVVFVSLQPIHQNPNGGRDDSAPQGTGGY